MDDDLLERSWVYQELVEEGKRRGFAKCIEEGKQRGFAKGVTEGMRWSIHAAVQARFPALADLAKEQIEHIEDQDALHTVLVVISAASTERKVRSYLLALHVNK